MTKLNGTKPKLQHISNLLDAVKKMDDLDALEGIVVVMQGTDKTFKVLAAHNGSWNEDAMHLALKQAMRKKPEPMAVMKDEESLLVPEKKLILPN
jgi:hypothetical protein